MSGIAVRQIVGVAGSWEDFDVTGRGPGSAAQSRPDDHMHKVLTFLPFPALVIGLLAVSTSLAAEPPPAGASAGASGGTSGDAPARWVRQPDAEALYKAYPQDALVAATGGKVRLGCVLGLDGKVRDCTIRSEEPAGADFGAAALGLAAGFELAPPTRGGKPVADAQVAIPVVFQPPPNVGRPNWKRLPDAADMEAVYSVEALRRGISGKAIIICLVATNGTLGACRVGTEDPPGLGFGAAALALAPSFLMSPKTIDGQPVDGGVVRIPIIFNTGAGRGFTPSGEQHLYRQLDWLRQPGRDEIIAAYQAENRSRPVNEDATVVLRCEIDWDGKLHNCKTLNATPSQRLAGAAERLSRLFRVRLDPKTGPNRRDMVDVTLHLRPDAPTDADAERLPPLKTVELTILQAPTAADLILPEAARKAGLATGWAAINCRVAQTGGLEACVVEAEQAPGLELGTAVIQASAKVRIATWNGLGEPTPGRRVRLRLDLKPAARTP